MYDENRPRLGLDDAKTLGHNSFLLGLESGVQYIVKRTDDPKGWKLCNLHTWAVWGTWNSHEDMVKELATAHMRINNPC
jgi:hypothetical protein